MKTKFFLIPFILCILVFIPIASAQTFDGYLETFDTQPPTPTPTAWYTWSCSQPPGGTCDWTVETTNKQLENNIHAGGHSGATVGLTTTVNNQDWNFYVEYQLNRDATDHRTSMAITFGASQFVSISLGGNTPFQSFVSTFGQCNDGFSQEVTSSPPVLALSVSGTISIRYTHATTQMSFFNDNGINSHGCSLNGVVNQDNVASFRFDAAEYELAGDSRYDNLVWNINNGATFTLEQEPVTATGAEFDEGLRDLATGVGFKSPESQLLFAIILIGLSEIGMAFFVGFMGPGKWQNWVIHTVAACVGIIMVLLTYLEFWILLVGIVLATTIVNGGRETLNTFRGLASFKKTGASPTVAAATAGQDGPRDAALRPELAGDMDTTEGEQEDSAESEPEEESESEPVAESESSVESGDAGSDEE